MFNLASVGCQRIAWRGLAELFPNDLRWFAAGSRLRRSRACGD
ncbi:MAG: hypothetical protein P8L18_10080 [Verrucomicrobiota bacterium]|nr:hypothetical protein [Verrucomicrobiota bacterium]